MEEDRRKPGELARLSGSSPRRWVSIAAFAGMAALLLAAAADPDVDRELRPVLLGLACLAVLFARAVWQATSRSLVLTEDALCDDTGRLLARVEDMISIERGVFAIKPSGGFVIRLNRPMPFGWSPGVWWRVGRRLGIGGALPGLGARALGEFLEARLAERDADG